MGREPVGQLEDICGGQVGLRIGQCTGWLVDSKEIVQAGLRRERLTKKSTTGEQGNKSTRRTGEQENKRRVISFS